MAPHGSGRVWRAPRRETKDALGASVSTPKWPNDNFVNTDIWWRYNFNQIIIRTVVRPHAFDCKAGWYRALSEPISPWLCTKNVVKRNFRSLKLQQMWSNNSRASTHWWGQKKMIQQSLWKHLAFSKETNICRRIFETARAVAGSFEMWRKPKIDYGIPY